MAKTKKELAAEIGTNIDSTKIKQPNDTLEDSQERCKNVVEKNMAIAMEACVRKH